MTSGDFAENGGNAASPETTATLLAGDPTRSVVGELRDEFGPFYRRSAGRLKLTLDVEKNLLFRARIDDALSEMRAQLGASFDSKNFSLDLDSDNKVNIVIVAADESGRIVRFLNNWDITSYVGLSDRREREDENAGAAGQYLAELETREIGSVAKVVGALGIAMDAKDKANTRWSNKCVLSARHDVSLKHLGSHQKGALTTSSQCP